MFGEGVDAKEAHLGGHIAEHDSKFGDTCVARSIQCMLALAVRRE